MSYQSDLRKQIVAALLVDKQPAPADTYLLDDTTPLGAGGLEVGSLALLNALVALEKTLGFTFEDGPVAKAKLRTLGDFVDFVTQATMIQRQRQCTS